MSVSILPFSSPKAIHDLYVHLSFLRLLREVKTFRDIFMKHYTNVKFRETIGRLHEPFGYFSEQLALNVENIENDHFYH